MIQHLIGILLCVNAATCYYLPGLAPIDYCSASVSTKTCKKMVDLYVNRLDSTSSIIPYEYEKFPFCVTKDDDKNRVPENLGQVVFGSRIQKSPYILVFGQNETCKHLCTIKYEASNKDHLKAFKFLLNGIRLNYNHHWIIDNLPVTICYQIASSKKQICQNSIPIGCFVSGKNRQKSIGPCKLEYFNDPTKMLVYNHVDLVIGYHKLMKNGNDVKGRIVWAKLNVKSKQYSDNLNTACTETKPMLIPIKANFEKSLNIRYTYSVQYQEEFTIKWSSRWDYVLASMPHSKIQWFSIFNSLVIVIFLSGMVAMILLKTLHRDIDRYNKVDQEEAQEEFGWKLVHGDVFRPPRKGMFLSVCLGSGTQILIMTVITLFLACIGFLSPANRGALMTCALATYVLLGISAGFVSARVYKSFGGERWKTNVIMTALLCPGSVFGICFILNTLLWSLGSSAAIPFTTILALLAMWFLVSVPLCFIGSFLGFKRQPIHHPVRTNQIPRQIPPLACYIKPVNGILMGGILPFGCIFIQLFFIMNSIWSTYVYYMFSLLFVIFLILLVTCSETAILLCYFHLCAEDYRWCWRSFLTSGSTSLYLFLYSIQYFIFKMQVTGAASTFLYFGYTMIIIWLFFLMTGTIGFMACFWFVSKIYSVVKVD